MNNLNKLFKDLYPDSISELLPNHVGLLGMFKSSWNVQQWASQTEISAEDLEEYPNAKLSQTPLMQALRESNE